MQVDTQEDRPIGAWRFCPQCARPLNYPEYGDANEFEDMECSCCRRPWIACPCTPASEGPCRAEVPDAG